MSKQKTEAVATVTVPTIDTSNWVKTIDSVSLKVQSIVIASTTDEAKASDLAGELTAVYNQAETARKAFVKPFNDVVSNMNQLFKSVTGRCESGKEILRDKIKAFRRMEEKRIADDVRKAEELRQKELAKLEKKAEKKGLPFVPPPQVARNGFLKSPMKKVFPENI